MAETSEHCKLFASRQQQQRQQQFMEAMFYGQDDFQEQEIKFKPRLESKNFKILKRILEYLLLVPFLCRVQQYAGHSFEAAFGGQIKENRAKESEPVFLLTNKQGQQTDYKGCEEEQPYLVCRLKFCAHLANQGNQIVRRLITAIKIVLIIFFLGIGAKFMVLGALNYFRSSILNNLKQMRPRRIDKLLFANLTGKVNLAQLEQNCAQKQDLIPRLDWQARWKSEQLKRLGFIEQSLETLGNSIYAFKESASTLYWLLGSLSFIYLLAGIVFVSKRSVSYDSLNFILDPIAERLRVRHELRAIIAEMIAATNKFRRTRIETLPPKAATLASVAALQPLLPVSATTTIKLNSNEASGLVVRPDGVERVLDSIRNNSLKRHQFVPASPSPPPLLPPQRRQRRNSTWGVSEATEAGLHCSIGKQDSTLTTVTRRESQMRRISEVFSPDLGQPLFLFDGQSKVASSASKSGARWSSGSSANWDACELSGEVRLRRKSRELFSPPVPIKSAPPPLAPVYSNKQSSGCRQSIANKDEPSSTCSLAVTLSRIDFINLVRPDHLTLFWHRKTILVHFAIYLVCEGLEILVSSGVFVAVLLMEGYYRAKHRFEQIQCEHLVPNGTLISDGMRLSRLTSGEHLTAYLESDGAFESLIGLAFKVEIPILFGSPKRLWLLFETLAMIKLAASWATFYIAAFVLSNNDKVCWLNQIKRQLDSCVERLTARRRAIPKGEDLIFRQEVSNTIYGSTCDDNYDEPSGADSPAFDESSDGNNNNSSSNNSGRGSNYNYSYSNKSSGGGCGCGQNLGAAKMEMDGDAELVRMITVAYLNFELFRRQHKNYKTFTNFLIIQTTLFIVETLILTHLSTSDNGINHSLILFGATFVLLFWCNIYLLSGTRVTNEISKVMVRIMRLLASGAQVSPSLAYLIGLWRRQILDHRSTRELFAPSLFDTCLSYQKLVEFNAYLLAFYLMLIK